MTSRPISLGWHGCSCLVWVAGLVTTTALGYWLASRALAPVVGISRRAARIARGDFAARLDPPVRLDEVGEMTQSLNEVLDRLHGALEGHRRFASDASHELRTPITAMAGEIDVALMRPRTAEEYRDTLWVVRERLSSLTTLCEDLVLLVHAQEGAPGLELREVPLLPQLQRSTTRLASAAAARDVRIEACDLPDLVAYADPRLLARVLDNVLANAVFYNRRCWPDPDLRRRRRSFGGGRGRYGRHHRERYGVGYPARRVRTGL